MQEEKDAIIQKLLIQVQRLKDKNVRSNAELESYKAEIAHERDETKRLEADSNIYFQTLINEHEIAKSFHGNL